MPHWQVCCMLLVMHCYWFHTSWTLRPVLLMSSFQRGKELPAPQCMHGSYNEMVSLFDEPPVVLLSCHSTQGGVRRFSGLVQRTVRKDNPLASLTEDTELDKEQFREVLKKIDSSLRALPATAQVSAGQGSAAACCCGAGPTLNLPVTAAVAHCPHQDTAWFLAGCCRWCTLAEGNFMRVPELS